MTSFYTQEELQTLGLKRCGKGVLLSRKASLYSPQNIEIGDNVRIDDFCILSGRIVLGNNIHISAYVALYGANGIFVGDYSGISPRTTIYSAMDDFSGDFLVGPIHPYECTNVVGGKVIIDKYTQVGCNCVIFPNITFGPGVAVGAMSLVNSNLEEWSIYVGIPAKRIRKRSKGLLRFVGD